MVRQRTQRKSIEELYAPKLIANPKSQVKNQTGNITGKNLRTERETHERERQYNNYIITANSGYSTVLPANPAPTPVPGPLYPANITYRRKTVIPKQPTAVKHEKHQHEVKKMDMKTGRPEKPGLAPYDMKTYKTIAETTVQKETAKQQQNNSRNQHNHRQQYNRQPYNPYDDEEKEDDTDEFFDLIKKTVQQAIGHTIVDTIVRNFKDLSDKVDHFSAELKTTNTLLNKLQSDVNSKVVHYGEENSRHFRYLCMKSEYDKMFYQHQSMMANPVPPVVPTMPTTVKPTKTSRKMKSCDNKQKNPCTRRSTVTLSAEPLKSSSADGSVCSKSSEHEVNMREVLDHIQRLCVHMKLKDEENKPNNMRKESHEEPFQLAEPATDEEDYDDDFQCSSDDGMTPPNEYESANFGGASVRSTSTIRSSANHGGGDA